ncbi:MAG: hypothetical protein AB7P76_12405 [Candidatus Melainabacteria bacterium]
MVISGVSGDKAPSSAPRFEPQAPKSAPVTGKRLLPFQGESGQPFFTASTAAQAQSPAARALAQLESSYAELLQSTEITAFNPNEIERYIRAYQKRTGRILTESQRERIMQIASSKDPSLLKLLALEFGIGVDRQAEKKALAALGQLFLERDDSETLQQFLEDGQKDENLKAHVSSLQMLNKIESGVAWYNGLRNWFLGLFKPFIIIFQFLGRIFSGKSASEPSRPVS